MESDKDVKQDARNDRLSLRKTNEEVLRIKLRLEAKKKCESYFRSFGDCAKTNGFMVVFNCRKENLASKQSNNLNLICISIILKMSISE